ncbi:MAG: hypothetical protein KJ574_03145 [Nanoarchaeota archaeon]|nr:hypothetical protein [Nanoarchaeota archaeon]
MEHIEMNVHEAKRMLEDVKPEEKFILNDGKQLSNLKELHDALGAMAPDLFAHHVNEHKNDFASWVHDSIKDPDLAKVIRHVKTQRGMKAAIKGRTYQLRKELKKDWFTTRFAKWEMLDFVLGILVGTGVAVIIVMF